MKSNMEKKKYIYIFRSLFFCLDAERIKNGIFSKQLHSGLASFISDSRSLWGHIRAYNAPNERMNIVMDANLQSSVSHQNSIGSARHPSRFFRDLLPPFSSHRLPCVFDQFISLIHRLHLHFRKIVGFYL